MMGFESPADQKVAVRVGDWSAMKQASWRSRLGWDIAARQAEEILSRCAHSDGCLGADQDTEPCLPSCPDREMRMSALVILTAAKQCAPTAHKPADEAYFAPSREYFSEVMAELAAAQVELEALRSLLKEHGVEPPSPQVVLSLPEKPLPLLEERPAT